MNRYNGSSGRVTKYHPPQNSRSEQENFRNTDRKAESINHTLCGRSRKPNKDLGDIWMLAVFFLLYLESGDTDFLIILAVLAFSMFDIADVRKLLGGM